jgi:hypothetical protein
VRYFLVILMVLEIFWSFLLVCSILVIIRGLEYFCDFGDFQWWFFHTIQKHFQEYNHTLKKKILSLKILSTENILHWI